MFTSIKRLTVVLILMVSGVATAPAIAALPIQATLYHHPGCLCCEAYARYLDKNGFSVKVIDSHDLAAVFRQQGVPDQLTSCHTMTVDGYIVVGHVPVDVVMRLLRERPEIRGISLPGMPHGSPGMGPDSRMGGPKEAPFVIMTITSPPRVYATR